MPKSLTISLTHIYERITEFNTIAFMFEDTQHVSMHYHKEILCTIEIEIEIQKKKYPTASRTPKCARHLIIERAPSSAINAGGPVQSDVEYKV